MFKQIKRFILKEIKEGKEEYDKQKKLVKKDYDEMKMKIKEAYEESPNENEK
ncbi:hypothetical protein [Polaribacter atrinae]|uniref:hypothetical protein n=1 Tax=Polaribacter atrinae TaxID=1333662 RepID=UPI000AADD948|nr:hypothetical protein [Polaribacter atrinae]